MIVRVLFAAVLAGLLAGVFYTAAQQVRVAPLILEAESYENMKEAGHPTGEHVTKDESGKVVASQPAGHAHDAGAWAPEDGFERTFYTWVSNSFIGVGYALLMAAAILISGTPISPHIGMLWGAAGFVVFVIAPGLGLPPELPGTVAAPVPIRQVWWLATVVLTAGGLALIAFKPQWQWIALAVAMIIAPHIIGAPQPVHHESLAPANLAVEYVVAAFVTNGLLWLFIGGALGWLLPRLVGEGAPQPA